MSTSTCNLDLKMKLPLTIIPISLTMAAFAAIEIGTITSEDVLEPSIQNEVDHALSRSSAFDEPVTNALTGASSTNFMSFVHIPSFWTNGLSATDKAIKLISLQNAEGRWFDGTNDVTRSVRAILQNL